MRWIGYILILSTIAAGCGTKKSNVTDILFPMTEEMKMQHNYLVAFINSEITIDGIDSEEIWSQASYTSEFTDIINEVDPKYSTKVKLLWDNINLYLFAKIEDPHLWSTMMEKDSHLYEENSFEIFIDPDDDGLNYLEIEINPLNTIFDLTLNKPYKSGGKANIDYSLKGLKHKVKLTGTLNNNADVDIGWNVEMSMPLTELAALSNKKNETLNYIRIQFSRIVWELNLENESYAKKQNSTSSIKPQIWVWAEQESYDNHVPQDWGYLHFSKEKSSRELVLTKSKLQNSN